MDLFGAGMDAVRGGADLVTSLPDALSGLPGWVKALGIGAGAATIVAVPPVEGVLGKAAGNLGQAGGQVAGGLEGGFASGLVKGAGAQLPSIAVPGPVGTSTTISGTTLLLLGGLVLVVLLLAKG